MTILRRQSVDNISTQNETANGKVVLGSIIREGPLKRQDGRGLGGKFKWWHSRFVQLSDNNLYCFKSSVCQQLLETLPLADAAVTVCDKKENGCCLEIIPKDRADETMYFLADSVEDCKKWFYAIRLAQQWAHLTPVESTIIPSGFSTPVKRPLRRASETADPTSALRLRRTSSVPEGRIFDDESADAAAGSGGGADAAENGADFDDDGAMNVTDSCGSPQVPVVALSVNESVVDSAIAETVSGETATLSLERRQSLVMDDNGNDALKATAEPNGSGADGDVREDRVSDTDVVKSDIYTSSSDVKLFANEDCSDSDTPVLMEQVQVLPTPVATNSMTVKAAATSRRNESTVTPSESDFDTVLGDNAGGMTTIAFEDSTATDAAIKHLMANFDELLRLEVSLLAKIETMKGIVSSLSDLTKDDVRLQQTFMRALQRLDAVHLSWRSQATGVLVWPASAADIGTCFQRFKTEVGPAHVAYEQCAPDVLSLLERKNPSQHRFAASLLAEPTVRLQKYTMTLKDMAATAKLTGDAVLAQALQSSLTCVKSAVTELNESKRESDGASGAQWLARLTALPPKLIELPTTRLRWPVWSRTIEPRRALDTCRVSGGDESGGGAAIFVLALNHAVIVIKEKVTTATRKRTYTVKKIVALTSVAAAALAQSGPQWTGVIETSVTDFDIGALRCAIDHNTCSTVLAEVLMAFTMLARGSEHNLHTILSAKGYGLVPMAGGRRPPRSCIEQARAGLLGRIRVGKRSDVHVHRDETSSASNSAAAAVGGLNASVDGRGGADDDVDGDSDVEAAALEFVALLASTTPGATALVEGDVVGPLVALLGSAPDRQIVTVIASLHDIAQTGRHAASIVAVDALPPLRSLHAYLASGDGSSNHSGTAVKVATLLLQLGDTNDADAALTALSTRLHHPGGVSAVVASGAVHAVAARISATAPASSIAPAAIALAAIANASREAAARVVVAGAVPRLAAVLDEHEDADARAAVLDALIAVAAEGGDRRHRLSSGGVTGAQASLHADGSRANGDRTASVVADGHRADDGGNRAMSLSPPARLQPPPSLVPVMPVPTGLAHLGATWIGDQETKTNQTMSNATTLTEDTTQDNGGGVFAALLRVIARGRPDGHGTRGKSWVRGKGGLAMAPALRWAMMLAPTAAPVARTQVRRAFAMLHANAVQKRVTKNKMSRMRARGNQRVVRASFAALWHCMQAGRRSDTATARLCHRRAYVCYAVMHHWKTEMHQRRRFRRGYRRILCRGRWSLCRHVLSQWSHAARTASVLRGVAVEERDHVAELKDELAVALERARVAEMALGLGHDSGNAVASFVGVGPVTTASSQSKTSGDDQDALDTQRSQSRTREVRHRDNHRRDHDGFHRGDRRPMQQSTIIPVVSNERGSYASKSTRDHNGNTGHETDRGHYHHTSQHKATASSHRSGSLTARDTTSTTTTNSEVVVPPPGPRVGSRAGSTLSASRRRASVGVGASPSTDSQSRWESGLNEWIVDRSCIPGAAQVGVKDLTIMGGITGGPLSDQNIDPNLDPRDLVGMLGTASKSVVRHNNHGNNNGHSRRPKRSSKPRVSAMEMSPEPEILLDVTMAC